MVIDRIQKQTNRDHISPIQVHVTRLPRHHSLNNQGSHPSTTEARSNIVIHVNIRSTTSNKSDRNTRKNDDSKKHLHKQSNCSLRTDNSDQKYNHRKISKIKKRLSRLPKVAHHEVITHIISANRDMPKVRDENLQWMNLQHKRHQNDKKKKKYKCSRRCVCASLMTCLLLTLAVVAILLVLLIKPSQTKTTPSTMPVLRWNTSGITVGGITGDSGNVSSLFYYPFGLAIDFSNTLHIADRYNHRIQKWPMNALAATTVAGQTNGTPGISAYYLQLPTDLAIDLNGKVYIADSWNHRIQLWKNGTSQGSTLAGNGGIPNITLYAPYGLARDLDSGTLYIADTYNHRVVRYRSGDLAGTVVTGGNAPGSYNTQLSMPAGLHFDSTSTSLLIADYVINNIIRWGIDTGSWTLVAGNFNSTAGSTSNELNSPFDVTMDPMGNVYVADRLNPRIQFFSAGQSTGKTIAGVTGVIGTNSTYLSLPSSLILDNQLNLYVADTNNQRIQKFLCY